VIDTEEVYLNYIYETVSSLGLVEHFDRFADRTMQDVKPTLGGLVIDIGSNDGTLLKFFKKKGMIVLGIDPSPKVAEKANAEGIETLANFFTEKFGKSLNGKYGKASVVTSNNLVADVDNLQDMIKGVREILAPDGVFMFESFYFLDQVKNLVFDFTYHEHFSYFTVKPLAKFFDSLGMDLIDAYRVETKGGSIRYTIQLKGGPRTQSPNIANLISEEEALNIFDPNSFEEYRNKIAKAKETTMACIKDLKDQGKTIVGFGASATSTTLIYHFGMGEILDYLVDDYKDKQGLYSPGFDIPVYSGEKLYETKPDYVVVLAWRYYEPIVKNYQKYLNEGGHFIVPLPELQIL